MYYKGWIKYIVIVIVTRRTNKAYSIVMYQNTNYIITK